MDNQLWPRPVDSVPQDLPQGAVFHIKETGSCCYCGTKLTGSEAFCLAVLICQDLGCRSRFNISLLPGLIGQYMGVDETVTSK